MSLAEQITDETELQVADWYKDAIIYQLHVKAYQDSNNDGMGDFAGLMSRLDHVQELGATAVWLLPFYPSPLRDDGYDIAEFKEVNPSYGTMEDFEGFVAEAHRRGLKVITELVINHTSDQHEWFQRARHAPKGSPERDFYVWSDDPSKWMDKTRVIFNDTHDSNWTWDPVAEQFYWHRFFDHQPDLNFDNPKVMEAVLDVMHFWLDKGVDGLRLDAIPYLVERDGTNNENLPETHDILKRIRANLDEHYDDKMLLAEANQWPEDTRPYFGEGDECHMGFHFPLMPRMYMAVAQEDRHPITDIIRQTPDIPDNCQWAIFLRNHDELTLEMVTDKERDYLWETYAADKRARINMGIRRRLAPLLQNDRRKIELLNSMLMSMPGTPILYYGDEIGMGDNIYLGDRDGVRTPMQWSPDRNAGFSRADPQRLYLPTIQDAIYGYESRNVESQAHDPSSYLNWMRRMVAVRQNHDVFGRGEMRLLYPKNRKVLAYIREHEGDAVLCVANLSRQAQAVEIDLSAYAGRVPIELTGHSAFPPVGALPYMVTLPAYGFYWFQLADEAEAPSWRTAPQEILPEFLTLTTRDGRVSSALTGREGRMLERDVLPSYLPIQRWFAAKDKTIKGTHISPLADLEDGRAALSLLDVDLGDETQQYLLPLAALWGEDNVSFGSPTLGYTLSKLRRGPSVGGLIDGTADVPAMTALFEALQKGGELSAEGGRVVFDKVPAMDDIEDPGEARLLNVEQSNATMAFSDKAILKLYRRLREGVQPDIEVSRFLTGPGGFDGTPAFLGELAFERDDGERVSLGAAFGFVRNQGDAWAAVTDGLERLVAESAIDDGAPDPYLPGLDLAPAIGRRTAEMHVALAKGTEPDFAPEPMTPERLESFADEVIAELEEALQGLSATSGLTGEAAALAETVLAGGDELKARVASLKGMAPSGALTRIHGDYHLGQVLVAQNDVAIIDFEGEPRRTLPERRAKAAPLRDLAGMIHSLDYAAFSARKRTRSAAADMDGATVQIEEWHARAQAELSEAYAEAIKDSPAHPTDPAFAAAMLDALYIQKAAYQVGYELAMRPTWLDIGLAALATRLQTEGNQ
ncbi:maltose alpha-D-glucosyltransferase [Pseudoroseicyclus tamaricis]|uniref:maltose alpha-D-glucosyltransferase n=1 Tax=Pseudoroseicyclus tamaricis TaxID=2705421 RepID=A0A6B2JNQ8_9RHOB|nr:maltose alpha-D-glucosyltransferase [Pseudoroseicyclus tamaricis]NDV00327.1 maltose alpha-D-glucosyltransferase [Pseudoroseicyclus tamaricis]